MAFFNSAVGVLQTLVVALGAGLGIWGAINLLEGYGNDNPGAKISGHEAVYGEIDVIKSEKGKAQSRRNRRCGQEILWKHKVSAIMVENT